MKPTEMPLEQLKKDPKFRQLSGQWTRLMVALPFAIVTSYYLYQRCEYYLRFLLAFSLYLVPSEACLRAKSIFFC